MVEAGTPSELEELERVLGGEKSAPRGPRAELHMTKLAAAIERAGARLEGSVSFDPERLLEAALAALRSRPPAGVEAAYVDGFVDRNRGALLGIVRGVFSPGQ